MAPITTVTSTSTTDVVTPVPSLLDPKQTLRATTALLRKIQSDGATQKSSTEKANLLEDADDEDVDDEIPIWLILTTKKHILDKKRLKPGKILLPHPYIDTATTSNLRICLITADPQRTYKDLIAHQDFPLEISKHIQRVIGLSKLKAKYKSFESRRQLLSEYDLFLADDRVITQLPHVLGKPFYSRTTKRPIPITLEGKRQSIDPATGQKRPTLAEGGSKTPRAAPVPADLAHEIARTLRCALVHLAPSTTTAVKIGVASQTPQAIDANLAAVVSQLVEKFVPRKWKNVRAVHVKGPNTAALPVWLTAELWEDERDVLEAAPAPKPSKKRKRGVLTAAGEAAEEEVNEVPGPDGKMRRLVKPAAATTTTTTTVTTKRVMRGDADAAKKRKTTTSAEEQNGQTVEKAEKAARKEALKKQKADAKAAVSGSTSKVKQPVDTTASAESKKLARKTRMKAEELF